jgi:hypothetical protein
VEAEVPVAYQKRQCNELSLPRFAEYERHHKYN